MFVYSGSWRFCECGIKTNLKDDIGNELRTGDIVQVYTIDRYGMGSLHDLSVVVSDRYITYTNGKIKPNHDDTEPYVMGIKNVDISLQEVVFPDSLWRVRLVKKWENVIDGEHWDNFKFNFKKD